MSPGMALIRPLTSMAWDLRFAWATGARVSLSLTGGRRREGWITRVSATDAFVYLGSELIPLDSVLAVHNPSRLGDSTVRGGPWRGPARRDIPQAEELPGISGRAA